MIPKFGSGGWVFFPSDVSWLKTNMHMIPCLTCPHPIPLQPPCMNSHPIDTFGTCIHNQITCIHPTRMNWQIATISISHSHFIGSSQVVVFTPPNVAQAKLHQAFTPPNYPNTFLAQTNGFLT